MGLFPTLSTEMADIHVPSAADSVTLNPAQRPSDIHESRASPAPATSMAWVDNEPKYSDS